MLKVGITGGIGSGKTIVCRIFELFGIPVFYADDAARILIDTDPVLMQAIRQLFGNDIYTATGLDRKKVSAIVFNDPAKLEQLNALTHPATIKNADEWMTSRKAPYAIKEAAIFFESGSHTHMDVMIGVDAPEEIRIQRAIQRSNISREEVLKRIARQMDNDEKMRRCDHVIINDGVRALIPQVASLHETLIARAVSS